MGSRPESAIETLRATGQQERKTQLFIRAITKGVLSERDLLLSYTVGEFYSEWSLFVEEEEARKKAHEEAMSKAGR